MKKLLLVLLVVTLASFLLVGCLGEGTVVDGDDVIIPPPVPAAVTIAVTNEYTNAAGTTYVPNHPVKDTAATDVDVTVTFTEAVEADDVVYIAKQMTAQDGTVTYFPEDLIETTPNAARTIWTKEDVNFLTDMDVDDCESFCLVALVGNPCCEKVEAAKETVKVDSTVPVIPTFTFKCGDCNACETTCEPEGAYFTFTSLVDAASACDEDTDSCDDKCSGVGTWSFKVGGSCDECVLAVGSGCPVAGTASCGCLPWQTAAEYKITPAGKDYTVVFTIADNVGNKNTETYEITVDTDSIVYCIGEQAE